MAFTFSTPSKPIRQELKVGKERFHLLTDFPVTPNRSRLGEPLPPCGVPVQVIHLARPPPPPDAVRGPRDPELLQTVIVNTNKGILFFDYKNPNKPPRRDPFPAEPVCFAVNTMSLSCSVLELAIGLSSGEILLYEVFERKISRLWNAPRAGRTTPPLGFVTALEWLKAHIFVAAFTTGCVGVYNRNREKEHHVPFHSDSPRFLPIFVDQVTDNPQSRWLLSDGAILALSTSPCGDYLATVGRDGWLRVLDVSTHRLLVSYKSYFGALLCVCWSNDSKYILTGGQDDLVALWRSPIRAGTPQLVARCEGHHSWVSAVAFDHSRCSEESGVYRFGSVGQDCRLLLWDFQEEELSVPESAGADTSTAPVPDTHSAAPPPSASPSPSSSSSSSSSLLPAGRPSSFSVATPSSVSSRPSSSSATAPRPSVSSSSAPHSRLSSASSSSVRPATTVPAAGWRAAPLFSPVCSHQTHAEPLCSLVFLRDSILTASVAGVVRRWQLSDVDVRAYE
eukprot:gnl/Spiro4/23574_TR11651_c0_g1_i1.p1 gnl/Spiro4/23574_TR11651_c0_g1~~gnl/Spiro4/23574_TR11651_c0_g1_i1.p1  ORF type:complete len:507 (+),score=91.42 gnl/Spiro4/23574_TR11651_c0_g1_i1:63-1583(+)